MNNVLNVLNDQDQNNKNENEKNEQRNENGQNIKNDKIKREKWLNKETNQVVLTTSCLPLLKYLQERIVKMINEKDSNKNENFERFNEKEICYSDVFLYSLRCYNCGLPIDSSCKLPVKNSDEEDWIRIPIKYYKQENRFDFLDVVVCTPHCAYSYMIYSTNLQPSTVPSLLHNFMQHRYDLDENFVIAPSFDMISCFQTDHYSFPFSINSQEINNEKVKNNNEKGKKNENEKVTSDESKVNNDESKKEKSEMKREREWATGLSLESFYGIIMCCPFYQMSREFVNGNIPPTADEWSALRNNDYRIMQFYSDDNLPDRIKKDLWNEFGYGYAFDSHPDNDAEFDLVDGTIVKPLHSYTRLEIQKLGASYLEHTRKNTNNSNQSKHKKIKRVASPLIK